MSTTATDYYELTFVTDVRISPDGRRAAVVADEFDAEEDERLSSVFVVPTDGSQEPHRLTRASSASSPRWSPDGTKLAVLAARDEDLAIRAGRAPETDNDDDLEASEEPAAQVWVYDLDLGGDPRQVTDFEEGVREFDWSPDGERIVVSARDPTDEQREYLQRLREDDGPIEIDRLQHKYDGTGWLDDVTTYLFVVDLDSRETTRLDDAYGSGASEPATGLAPAWSPHGDRIAFLSNRSDWPDNSRAMDVYTIAPDGTGIRRITDNDLTASSPVWSPDGRKLAFGGRKHENMYEPTQVFVADLDAGGYESISADLDRPLGRGGSVVWTDETTLLGPIGDEGTTRLVRFHADGSPPERVFERQGRHRTIAGFHAAGDTTALLMSRPDDGTDAYAAETDVLTEAGSDDADPLTRLTRVNEAFVEEHPMPQCERITFESEDPALDTATVEALVYLPEGFDPDDPEPLPTIASIHGGPVSYDAPNFRFQYVHWTARGYAVVRVNYRGSSSYGQEFSEAISGDWGNREPTDIVNGVREAVDRGWADPDRLFVTGFSYGGVSTAFVLTQYDDFIAGAAEHGIYDRYSYFGTGDSHNRMESDFGLPWEEPETYESISSIGDVGGIDDPLLVTAGGQDWRCPPTQGEQLYVSVKKQGVPARLVVYPNEHHNIGDPDRAIHRIEELTGWFERFDPEGE